MESTNGGGGQEETTALRFLDSLDGYVSLLDSLSSTLRQGWLELASARHSMGSSRISSALFDLKVQSAATTCRVIDPIDESQSASPHFTLSKWLSSREGSCSPGEEEVIQLQKKSSSSQLRYPGLSHSPAEETKESELASCDSHPAVADVVQRERSKALLVFGALVSPKLHAAQNSFETALEIIVELANMRASLLSSHSRLQRDAEGASG